MSTRTTDHVSSASHPDDDAVNRAKQEIQGLVQEVVALSKSEIEESDFFAALLEKSISALAAIGGVVWTLEENQPFKLQYQVNLQQTGLAASQAAQMLSRCSDRAEGRVHRHDRHGYREFVR